MTVATECKDRKRCRCNRSRHASHGKGWIARLGLCLHATGVGFEPNLRLKKAGLSEQQIEDRDVRLSVRAQIRFLSLVARFLADEFPGVRLADFPVLRELGLLFYVAASSLTLRGALRRAASPLIQCDPWKNRATKESNLWR